MRRAKALRIVLKALVFTAVMLSLLQLLAPLILAPPGSEEKTFQPTIVRAQAVAPTTAQTSSVANISINYTAVASINAVASYYYAVNTTLTGNLSAFYVNWTNGKIYYIPTYIWDANTKYIIFQAPASTTIYLIYNTSQSIPVLSTRSWFNIPPAPTFGSISVSVTFPSPWSTTQSTTMSPSVSLSSINVYYNGSVVVNATYTASYSGSVTASVAYSNNLVSTGATYTASISVTSNPNNTVLSASPNGYSIYQDTAVGTFTLNNGWIYSYASYYCYYYPLSYSSASGFTSSASVSITTSSGSAFSTTGSCIPQTLYYKVSFSGSSSANSIALYSKDSSGVITASNGNKIVPIDSAPLTVSSSSSSLTVYLSSSSNLTYSLSLSLPSYTGRNVSISLPPGYAFVNITNSSGSLVSSSLYTISYSSSSAHMFFNETLPAYYGSSLTVYLTAKNIITNISLSNPKPLYDPSDWANMTLNITLQDPLGSPLTGYQVNMNITTASGSLVYTGSNTSSSGYAVFNLNLSLTSGTYKITLFTTEAYAGFYTPTPFLSTGYMSISPGDTLAPHLYVWYFDGVDDYINVSSSSSLRLSSSFTLAGWFLFPSATAGAKGFVQKNPDPYDYDYMLYLSLSGYPSVYFKNSAGSVSSIGYPVDHRDNRWHFWTGTFDGRYLNIFTDGVLRASANTGSQTVRTSDTPLTIGYGYGGYVNMFSAYVLIYSRALSDSEIYNAYAYNIINASNLVLFLDPTFFDGSKYIDLSPYGNNGVPYNGVLRIPDNRTWIYLVKGSGSGPVNLRFFPSTTALLIYDSSGNVVGRIDFSQLTSQYPAYSSGIVPGPIPINLPAGSYRLELYNTSYIQITGMKSYGFDVTTATIKTVLVNSRSPTKYIRIDNINISPNDTLAPHLYVWYFDGVNDYVAIPLTVYGWSGITIQEWLYPFYPKANPAWSKFSMIGDVWVDRPSVFFGTNDRYDYTGLSLGFFTRKQDGTNGYYGFSIYAYINRWVNTAWRFSLADRALIIYINGGRVYTASVPSTEYTILEWNPATATYPLRYQQFVLGANVLSSENMKMMQGNILIYSRALSDSEIYNAYAYNIINASNLVLFLDPTFYNGTHFIDLSGYNNHGVGYNGVARIPDNRTWIYLVKNLSSDNLVHLRFFPVGTVYVFRSLAGYIISYGIVNGSVNSAGLVEDFVINIPQGSYTVEFYIPDPGSTTYQYGSSYVLSSTNPYSPGISLSSSEPVRVAVGSYAYICFLPFYTYNNTLIRSFNMNISVGSSAYSISSSSPCINISSSTVSVVKISPTSFLDLSYNITTIDSSYTTSASIVFDRIQIKFDVQPSYVVAVNSSATLFGTARYVSDGYPVSDGVVDISDGYNIYRARITNGQFSFSYRPNSTGTVSFYAVRAVDFPNPVSISFSSYSENSVIPIAHAQALGSGYGFVTAYTTDMVQITFYVVQPVAAQIIGVSTFLTNLGSSVVYLLLGFSMSIGIFVIMAKIYDWPVAGVFASFVLLIMFLLAGLTGPATVVLIFLILFLAFAVYRS